jgi:hypothetical protein
MKLVTENAEHLLAAIAAALAARESPRTWQRQAVHHFAALNDWRVDNYNFALKRLGRRQRGDLPQDSTRRHLFDHALHFRSRDGRNIAIVGQPYSEDAFDEAQKLAWRRGLELHVPPAGPLASIWYPGATQFLLFTLPEHEPQWLPEQMTLYQLRAQRVAAGKMSPSRSKIWSD